MMLQPLNLEIFHLGVRIEVPMCLRIRAGISSQMRRPGFRVPGSMGHIEVGSLQPVSTIDPSCGRQSHAMCRSLFHPLGVEPTISHMLARRAKPVPVGRHQR
jgi:hypothetical protein